MRSVALAFPLVVGASVLTTLPATAGCYGPGCPSNYYSSGPGYGSPGPTYYNNGPTYYSSGYSSGYTNGYGQPVPVYRQTYYVGTFRNPA